MWRILGYALVAVYFEVSETSLSLRSSHHFASAGESPVEFTCTSSAVIESGGVWLLWFKKNASDVLERLDTKCNASPCKYTDESNRSDTFKLKITKTEREDSGTYYCAHPPGMDLEFSNGAALNVVADSSTETTSVSILAPADSASALDSEGSLTLVCLVRGLSSPAVRFQWFLSGNVTTATAPGTWIKEGGDGESYSATSRLTIPAETWRSGAVCACGAQLNSSTVIRSREISYTAGDSCWVFYVVFSGAALVAVAAALLASCAWLHFCSKEGSRQRADPADQFKMRRNDDLVTYAHLEFVPQKKERRKRQA
ncbi:uncharacterized protein LOC121307007 isoform X2 [Polyodon spathula]|uniref:uncharacterized protein LOC121307007 isoform X2 n=1 Tax=Polyodon spathula TaxID=7913 RepID=UPI001B7D98D5|nr:uncharacterized protein LOC121307007 isoform X2 [Polyodon spathula]